MDNAPAAIMATTGKLSTLADGTLRIVVEIPPGHAKDAFSLFSAPGTPVALARIAPEVSVGQMRKETIEAARESVSAGKGPHGAAYTLLYRSGFWFAGALHEALGITGEVAQLRQRDASPSEISDLVKGILYSEFGVDSLSEIDPVRFRAYMAECGIEHLLPREF